MKSAYDLLFLDGERSDPGLDILWKLHEPSKLKIFFLLILHGRILTNEQRARRQLTIDSSCRICDWPYESIIHLLRDCPIAQEVWKTIRVPTQVFPLANAPVKTWCVGNVCSKTTWGQGVPWHTIFIFTC